MLSNFYQRINSYHSGLTHGNRDRAILAAEQLFVEAFHRRRHPGHEDDHLVRSCLGLCHERLAEPLHFTDIADELGVSYSLLRQRIRQSTGQSPAKLLLQMRCNYAQELLQDPELTIQQIATECGFEDPYTFSRSFKRSVGGPKLLASACSDGGAGLDCKWLCPSARLRIQLFSLRLRPTRSVAGYPLALSSLAFRGCLQAWVHRQSRLYAPTAPRCQAAPAFRSRRLRSLRVLPHRSMDFSPCINRLGTG